MKTKLLSVMSLIVVAMKTKVLILSTIIALIGVLGVNAQDIIPVDSVQLLNKGQKNTLQYAKKVLKSQDNKVMLPLEINALLGDTINPMPYEATPIWEEACFVNDSAYESSLMIPLKTKTLNGEVISVLNVIGVDKYTFCRFVTTQISYSPDICIDVDSNLEGIMLVTTLYEHNELKGQALGVSTSYGVVDCTYKYNYDIDMDIYRRYHTNYKPIRHYDASSSDFYSKTLVKSVLETRQNAKGVGDLKTRFKIGFN